MAEKVVTPEQSMINAVSWLFFLKLGVILKKDYGRGRKIPFSQASSSVRKEALFGAVPNG